MGDDGRARTLDGPADPDVELAMDAETFAILGAGRRDPRTVELKSSGDAELVASILASMVLTR